MSRPTSQHRLSVGSPASSLPTRHSYSRTHSNTVSHGTLGTNNRISRRKSSSFAPGASTAAIEAAVESAVADGSVNVNRRSTATKSALGALNEGSQHAHSMPKVGSVPARPSSSAIADGPPLASCQDADKSGAKVRARRASDGTALTKKEKAAAGELRCEHCGKGYKHGSCLTKHLWEHTPQWQVTSKLLISKHQQVQLLEAASVLVAMNGENGASNDSDNSSSPAASGSSDPREEPSSAETTPPPAQDGKRFSNSSSSAYSRSYQSVFSSESMPQEHGFSHNRHWSTSSNNRPVTAGTSIADSYRDEDPADLTAAINLLSCSYGTPKSGPTGLPEDVPPVPPLPAKYQSYSASGNAFNGYRKQEQDVDMEDESSSEDDVHNARMDDADEGMFGKMDA